MDEMRKIDEMLMMGKISPREAELLKAAIRQAEERKERILEKVDFKGFGQRRKVGKLIGWLLAGILLVVGIFAWIGGNSMDRQYLFALLIFGVFLWAVWEFIFVWLKNRLVVLEEDVKEKWARVLAFYHQKEELVEELIGIVEKQRGQERELIELITQARDQLKGLRTKGIEEADKILNRVVGIVEGYPQIVTNSLAQEIASRITMLEQLLTEARVSYNHSVRKYNAFVGSFPGNLLVKVEEKDYLQVLS